LAAFSDFIKCGYRKQQESNKNLLMKKILLTTFGVVFTFTLCMAQDVILLSTGEDLEVRVLEITKDEIRYKLADSLDATTYTLQIKDAWMVRYEDGESIVLKQDENTSAPATVATPGNPDACIDQKPVTIAGKALEVVFSPFIKLARLPAKPENPTETAEPPAGQEKSGQPGGFLTGLFIEVGLNLLSDWLSHGNVSHVHW
jgi:hypothetical protein